MQGKSLYFVLAAIAAVFVGVVWCFTSGPCSGSTSSGQDSGSGLAGVVGAATNAIQDMTQVATPGSNNPLDSPGAGLTAGGS